MLVSDLVPTPFGWGIVWAKEWPVYLFVIYHAGFFLTGFSLLLYTMDKSSVPVRRIQTKIVCWSTLLSYIFGAVSNITLPWFNIRSIPEIADLTAFGWIAGMAYVIIKYKFLIITPALAAERIISTMNDMVILLNPKAIIMNVNKAVTQLLRYEEKELTGQPIDIILDANSLLRFKLPKGEQFKNQETTFIAKTGKQYLVSVSASLLNDENSVFVGIVCLARDITEHKQMEQALIEEKERLATTLCSVADGVIATDVQGNIVLFNKVAEQLTELSFDAVNGRLADDVLQLRHEVTREKCALNLNKILVSGNIIDLPNIVLLSRSGKEHFVLCRAVVMRDKHSDISGAVIVLSDITEKQKWEQEARRMQKLEAINIFIAGIAHDFNNILTVCLGNSAFIKMRLKNDQESSEMLLEMEGALLQSKNLTQQLLTVTKGGAPVKINAAIGDLLKECTAFVLRGSKTRYEFIFDEHLWAVEIDVNQISQVIQNLIINADQAMPQGGMITIRAENAVVLENSGLPLIPGKYVKISIHDTGCGISPENLKHLFTPFFTTKQKGSGLGLAGAYSIIKKHEGYIYVESELGKGTVFHIYFLAAVHSDLLVTAGNKYFYSGKGKILVMEDEESLRKIVSKMLETLGYQVVLTVEGSEAINLYRATKNVDDCFDAVIFDLTVRGGMGGQEALKQLLAIDSEIKAIATSGYTNDPVMLEPKNYGFLASIPKPYKMEELGKVLSVVIGKKNNQ
jgi:PAS domain S-box-containing protein